MKTTGPKTGISINTYAEFDRYLERFATGRLACLFVIGPPGVQKSTASRAALRDGALYISGQATPFEIYAELCEQQPRIVILDDVDGLHRSPSGVRLLKCLCSADTRKTISWLSSAVHARGLPPRFLLDCKVLLLANEWESLSENVLAVEDRGVVLSFEPTPLEVHIRTAAWYWDQQIHDFVGQHLHLFRRLSMRVYELAWQLRAPDGDDGPWQHFVLRHTELDDKDRLLVALLGDPRHKTDEERAMAFENLGGGCRATYFNRKKALPPWVEVPRLSVQGTPPIPPPIDPSNFRDSRQWQDLQDFARRPSERRYDRAQAAYRTLLLGCHPDKGGTEEATKEINQAWDAAQGRWRRRNGG